MLFLPTFTLSPSFVVGRFLPKVKLVEGMKGYWEALVPEGEASKAPGEGKSFHNQELLKSMFFHSTLPTVGLAHILGSQQGHSAGVPPYHTWAPWASQSLAWDDWLQPAGLKLWTQISFDLRQLKLAQNSLAEDNS